MHAAAGHVLIQNLKLSSQRIGAIQEPVRFKQFILDPRSGLLDRGTLVRLRGPALLILRALVARAGQTVSKQLLMDSAWGQAAVSDNTLQVHVASLRRLLGEDCIATRQGVGYRFVAVVEPAGSTGTGPVHCIPPSTGRLIGRQRLLGEIVAALARYRLVTLTGCGGVGKTRLMQAVAEQLASDASNEVWFVRLDVTRDPALVPNLVAAALNAELNGDLPPVLILGRLLAARRGVLLLDNCEHVLEAVAMLAQALADAAPRVRILATSRAALGCAQERVLPVPTLSLPASGEANRRTRRAASVEMFIDSARAADPAFCVADADLGRLGAICRRLDGLPLAIRVAASWASVLGLSLLDARLERSLSGWADVRVGGEERHGTLEATFAWSFDLLTPAERIVLRRLSVFARGFGLAEAEAVLPDTQLPSHQVGDALFQLVRQSLVIVVPSTGAGPRSFRLLETIRSLARDKLIAAAEEPALSRRHADHVRRTLEAADLAWETTGDALWLAERAPPLADVRLALGFLLSDPDLATQAASLAGASWPLWREMSLCSEGRRHVEAAARAISPGMDAAIEGRLRLALGDLLRNAPSAGRLEAEFRQAVILLRGACDPLRLGRALAGLALALLRNGESSAAWQPLDEACRILESSPWPRAYASALQTRVHLLAWDGRIDEACETAETSAAIFRRLGATRSEFTVRLALAGYYLEWGRPREAVLAGRDLARDLAATSHQSLLGYALGNLCASHVALGALDDALTTAREAVPLLQREGALDWLFDHMALRLVLAGDPDGAALLAGFVGARPRDSRQRAERQAHDRLHGLLRARRSPAALADLVRRGGELREEQALAIALCEPSVVAVEPATRRRTGHRNVATTGRVARHA